MYLSRVRLVNWRSYADAVFDFDRPTNRKPLVLIGAMNGHGKTSFLVSLYLGLFGRFGLRYCEGFDSFTDDTHYRKAIALFRRDTAPAEEPTSVELVFSRTLSDTDEEEEEIRIIRRWFFTSANQPKQAENFEQVEVYRDEKPQRSLTPDLAHDRLEKYLFPAHVMPAFFFDGEQAQMLINNSGESGIKKAVEVMFGTKVLDEAHQQIEQYITSAHGRLGGKKQASQKEHELQSKCSERKEINDRVAYLEKQREEIEGEKDKLVADRKQAQEALARLGGEKALDVKRIQEDVLSAEHEKTEAERDMSETTRNLGMALAVSRLATPILHRLESEEVRETWERLRAGTLERADQVLAHAIPDPPSQDELLGNLSAEIREKVRARFRKALEQIYNPPPSGCAQEYLLGHVMGEPRQAVIDLLARARRQGAAEIRSRAKRLKEAREAYEEADARSKRFANLPQEVSDLADRISTLNGQIDEAIRRLTGIENEIKKMKSDLHALSAEIGRLQEEVAKMEPEQRRIAIAERIHRVLDGLSEKLRPITLRHLEEGVTKHFLSIADKRFRGGHIRFPQKETPQFEWPNGKKQSIDIWSGFERRSFGIAFSLALAEITQKRVPLVIDTPLGNADSEYRPRLVQALTKVELDQIIILTHDQEVHGELLQSIEKHTLQKFLVEYDESTRQSQVRKNAYFER